VLGLRCQAGACAAWAAEAAAGLRRLPGGASRGAGPACQSEVGSALRGLESEREVGEGADTRAPCDREREGGGTGVGWSMPGRKSWAAALVWAGLLGCPGKEEKWSGLGRLG